MKIKAVVFDLDGTLIDSKMDLVNSVNATLVELKREALPTDVVASYVGSGAPTLIRRSLGGNPSEEELKRALAFFLVHYEEHKLDETRLYPGVKETLAELKSLPMSVLTNKPARISVRILEGLGVAQYFRCIYGGNSFTTKKPDPEGANLAFLRMTQRWWAIRKWMCRQREMREWLRCASILDLERTIAMRIRRTCISQSSTNYWGLSDETSEGSAVG